MTIQEIENKLSKVFAEFVSLYIPPHLQQRFEANAFLAGGCIYSLKNDKEPKDYDFFVTDAALVNLLLDAYRGRHDVTSITKYAITLGERKYQIVIKYVGSPDEVTSQFDFKHNMFYFYRGKITGLVEPSYLETDRLSFNDTRARDICGVLMRIPKFVSRGMKISRKEYASILLKLHNNFDDNEVQILNDTCHY